MGIGHRAGAPLPDAAYFVPLGALVFTLSIAVDTIGHRTVYKQEIARAEGLVSRHHHPLWNRQLRATDRRVRLRSVALDPGDGAHRPLLRAYSLIDEAFHWRRYVSSRSDRVEMWSHVGIFVGHPS